MRCHISTATLCKGVPTFCRGCWMASHLVGSLITCSEGCVGPGLSLAWIAWLRLRCTARPMKGGELAVCSSHSSENYWNMVEPRFQPCVAEDISPRPIYLCLRSGLSVSTPCVFTGVISRKRHGLRPGRTCVTQNQLCRRCRALVEPE